VNDESDAACDKRVVSFSTLSLKAHIRLQKGKIIKKKKKNNRKETRSLVLSFTYTDTRSRIYHGIRGESWTSWNLFIHSTLSQQGCANKTGRVHFFL